MSLPQIEKVNGFYLGREDMILFLGGQVMNHKKTLEESIFWGEESPLKRISEAFSCFQ